MTPQERKEFEDLKKLVQSLVRVQDVPFIGNLKRRIPTGVIDDSTSTTVTTIIKSVNEAGATSYNVAKAPDKKVGVTLTDGTVGFIGLYNS